MKHMIAACAIAVLTFSAAMAEDKKEPKKEDVKIDAAKLVGKWELTKTDEEAGLPKGTIVEFTKDKINATLEFNGKKLELSFKYVVKGDKLTVTITGPDGGEGKDQTDTIKSLSDDKLVLVDDKGKVAEFTKKK